MGIKLIIAAYFALVATMFVAGVVMLSVHDLQESRLNALDNPYLAAAGECLVHGFSLVRRDYPYGDDLDCPRRLTIVRVRC